MGPQLIGPSKQPVSNQFSPNGHMVPKILVPMDKWSTTNLVPLDKWSLEYSVCPGGQAVMIWRYEDQIGWGPFVQGDQILGDHLSRGIDFMGIVCSGGQEVGDRKFRDQMGSGPFASQLWELLRPNVPQTSFDWF